MVSIAVLKSTEPASAMAFAVIVSYGKPLHARLGINAVRHNARQAFHVAEAVSRRRQHGIVRAPTGVSRQHCERYQRNADHRDYKF
jgi:hypothetical protein